MKFKNYRSAIHNFAHSFQSVDYTKSGKLALNVLIRLHNSNLEPTAVFDFVKRSIEPREAVSQESLELLGDYLEWLPQHLTNHNCDVTKLEKLEIIVSTNFEKVFTPPGMKNCKQLNLHSVVRWKADGRNEELIEISQDEVIDDNLLRIGLTEM